MSRLKNNLVEHLMMALDVALTSTDKVMDQVAFIFDQMT